MDKKVRIAIDGPGGAGKSTIAKLIARDIGADYVDTGAMYRAVAYKMKQKGIGLRDENALAEMLSDTAIDFSDGDIMLDGVIVNDRIRAPEISALASDCSALAGVREKLVALQREMGGKKSVVMDGRDIGTNVLPDAEFKIYLTAEKEERARRRFNELASGGRETSYEQVLSDIVTRDRNDMTRKLNPLRKADGAIELDTTEMTVEEVRARIMNLVRGGEDGDSKAV